VSTPLPPPDLRARVLAAAKAEPVPPRRAATWTRIAAIVVGLGVSYGILAAIGGPGNWGRSSAYVLLLTSLWGLTALAAGWAGVSRGKSMLGRPMAWRVGVALLVPLALLASSVVANTVMPPPFHVAHWSNHLTCIEFSSLMAVGPLVAYLFVRRGSDPVAPHLTGAALGAAAGAVGAVGIELRCSHATFDHVLLGHVLPVAFLALLGALIAGRVVAVRRS
jgi:hypothetical protein